MQEFESIIDKLIALFDELTVVEQQKLQAASVNDIVQVENCMNQEQAGSLRIRGLDKEREEAQQRLGLSGLKFSEILEKVSEEDRERLKPKFDALSERIRKFQDISSDVNRLIEINLYKIDRAVEIKEAGRYTADGQEVKKPIHFTSRKI